MARMPASTPTIKVRADTWLPEEYVEILTYGGAGAHGAISDALVAINMDPNTRAVISARYAPEAAALERRRQAVVGWQLFEEKTPGVAGVPIPFTTFNVANLDPAYAQWLDVRIRDEWAKWGEVTKRDTQGTTEKEVDKERKPFSRDSKTAPRRGHSEDSQEEDSEELRP